MPWIDFSALSLSANVLAFSVGAGVIWLAGTRLASHAAKIVELTRLGPLFVGMLLVGGITSLPEIAVTTAAGMSGNASLAVNNILGGVALQVVVIAIGDAALRGRPLSSATPAGSVTAQALLSSLLLVVVALGVLTGDVGIYGLGLWTSAIALIALAMLWWLSRRKSVSPVQEPERDDSAGSVLRGTIAVIIGLAIAITAAGYVVARTSEALAEQTGLGQSFMGAVFTGLSTSLPEISTVLGAVWLRQYALAFSDIFGTNIFDVMLLFLIDVVYIGPPVLSQVGLFAAFAATLGAVVSLIYAAGLTWRPKATVAGVGVDSLAVTATYFLGILVLYTLR